MTMNTEDDEYPEIYPPAYAALEKLWDIGELVGKLHADGNEFVRSGAPPPEALVLRKGLRSLFGEPGHFSSLDVSEALFKASKTLNEKRKAAQSRSVIHGIPEITAVINPSIEDPRDAQS